MAVWVVGVWVPACKGKSYRIGLQTVPVFNLCRNVVGRPFVSAADSAFGKSDFTSY